jgi:hypothetical protein
MSAITERASLYSTVSNTSLANTGVSIKTFGFLPPHGRKLSDTETFTCYGDIRQAIINHDRVTSRRNILAFEHALDQGWLTIIQTPGAIIENPDAPDTPKILQAAAGLASWTVPTSSDAVFVEGTDSDVLADD